MDNKGSMTTPVWFDRWIKQAENRRIRQKQVTEWLNLFASVLVLIGLMFCIIGAGWIDSMDICRDNILLMFSGVALAWAGSRIKWGLR